MFTHEEFLLHDLQFDHRIEKREEEMCSEGLLLGLRVVHVQLQTDQEVL